MKRFPLKTWDGAFRRAAIALPLYAALFIGVGIMVMPETPQRLPNDDMLYPEQPAAPPWMSATAWGWLAAGTLPLSLGSAVWFLRVRREENAARADEYEERLQAWRREREQEKDGPLVGFETPLLRSDHDPFEGDAQHTST